MGLGRSDLSGLTLICTKPPEVSIGCLMVSVELKKTLKEKFGYF